MRTVSVTARMSHEEAMTDEVMVLLIMVEHPSLSAPIRISSDPTERLSVDPPSYCTRSTWMGANPATEPFLFAAIEAELPGDQEDAPSGFTLVMSTIYADVAKLLTSFTDRATAHFGIVFASQPHVLEQELRGAKMVTGDGDAGEIVLTCSRNPIEEETVPSARHTKHRFPGLFR